VYKLVKALCRLNVEAFSLREHALEKELQDARKRELELDIAFCVGGLHVEHSLLRGDSGACPPRSSTLCVGCSFVLVYNMQARTHTHTYKHTRTKTHEHT
jgi:hypothetical protein